MSIAVLSVLNFAEIYSVTPRYLLLRNLDLSTGPLINLSVNPLFKILKAILKHSSI